MKRPMAVIGISFLFTLVIIGKTGEHFAVIFLAISALAFIPAISIKSLRQASVLPSACLAVASACLLFILQTQYEYKPQLSFVGENVSVEGTVLENQGKTDSGSYRYIIKTSKVNGKDYKMKIRLSSTQLADAEYYDNISIKNATIYELGNDSSIKLYYKSTGVYIGAYTTEEIEHTKTQDKPFYYIFISLREYIKDTISGLLPNDEGAVLIAMLIGDTDSISDEAYKRFKESGVMHLFAVSGLHTSMWSMFIYQGLRNAGVRRKKSAAAASLFVLGFMALAAFTPSVMRAGIMMLVFFSGKLLGREPDSLNSLGTAALFVTVCNPFCASNLGLLLSFSATLGILLLLKPISSKIKIKTNGIKNQKLKNLVKVGVEITAITISATIFTFPVVLFSFGAVSFVSPITNLLITNVAGLAMLLSGIGVLLSAIPFISVIKMPIFFVCGLFAKFMLWCTKMLGNLPFAYVSLHNDYIIPWMIATFLLIAIAIILKGDIKKNLRVATLLALNILLCAVLFDKFINRGITKIDVADVGNGTSVILSRENHSAIIGCGGDYFAQWNIEDLLFQNNSNQIDLLVIPRENETESSAKDGIFKSYTVVSKIEKSSSKAMDSCITLWNDVEIYCSSNELSSFSTVEIGDFKILITFIPTLNTGEISQEFLNADVLVCRAKVPQGLDYNQFGIIIISDEPERAQETVQIINQNGGNAVATGGSSIEIKTRGGSDFSARRNAK
ncbi:MAG: ComEC/Rec2 family competence protein [Clostridia bacterium]|nr:ComEC/Rec2 family competence protein [Clostridia bacterium]